MWSLGGAVSSTPFADLPEFGTLIEQLVWVGREGGTPDFEDWLYDLLDDADPDEIEPLTVMLASHGGLLRHEIDIADRWKVLEDAIQRNPELRDLLLGHLDIWRNLDDERLIDVVNSQLNHFGQEKARDVMIFFLGYDRALVDVSVPEEWREPLRAEYVDWAMDRLQRDPASPAIETAFHFRNDDAYWQFAMREGIEDRLPCLLGHLVQKPREIKDLSRYFNHDARQVDDECMGGGALPGSSFFKLGRKLWHGTPVETSEVGWAAVDVADAAVTIASFGGGKLAVPALKGGLLGLRGLRGAKTAAKATLAERKLPASQVAKNVMSSNQTRRAVASQAPGLPRVLGVAPSALISRARAQAPKLPPKVKDMLKETAERFAGWQLENAQTTEFIRCAGVETLEADDPVCRALFPPGANSAQSGDVP